MKLEEYRNNNKLTYEQLSEFLDVPKSVIYNTCKERGCCSLPNAHRIVTNTLGVVDYADLLGDC